MPPADMYYEPGDIVSPNYGDGLYPPFSHCEWHVRVPLDVEKACRKSDYLNYYQYDTRQTQDVESMLV